MMCFCSETGGLLPDRVSTFQEVVSLHLKVPSSQLSSLQMKDQLTKVQHSIIPPRAVLDTMCIMIKYVCCILTGRKRDMVRTALSSTPAEGDGSVSHPSSASQACAAGCSHDRLHDSGGLLPRQQLLPTR